MADDIREDIRIRTISEGFDKLQTDLDKTNKTIDDWEKSVNKSEAATKQANDSTAAFRKTIEGFVAGALVAKAGQALLQFGKDSIQAASDVGEMQSKFNTVFKDLAGNVSDELANFAEQTNRSRYDLMGFAATMQDTFVPLGFARDQAAKMSVQVVELATDLASFNNLNTADVVRDIQSALVGNTETLRKYGVVANDAQVKAKALEMGLYSGKGAIDAQSKASAILQIAIEGNSDAMGDATRTADSFANQSRGLESAIKDLQVAIGQGLIPVMQQAQPPLTQYIEHMATNITTLQGYIKALDQGIITQDEFNAHVKRQHATAVLTADAQDFLTQKTAEYQKKVEAADATEVQHVQSLQNVWNAYQITHEKATPVMEDLAKMGEDTKVGKLDVSGYLKGLDAVSQAYDGLLLSAQNFQKENYGNQILSIAGAAWQAGEITKDQYKTVFGEVATQLMGMSGDQAKAAEDMLDNMDTWKDGSVADAQAIIDKVLELDAAINHVPKDNQINFNITTTGDIPNIGGGPTKHGTQTTGNPGTTTTGGGSHIPEGFATGGYFTTPGTGGVDSTLVSFWATPGEPVAVGGPAVSGIGGKGGGVSIGDIYIDASSVTDPVAVANLAANMIANKVRNAMNSGLAQYPG